VDKPQEKTVMTLISKNVKTGSILSLLLLLPMPVHADSPADVEVLTAAGTFLTSRLGVNADGMASSWCTLQIR